MSVLDLVVLRAETVVNWNVKEYELLLSRQPSSHALCSLHASRHVILFLFPAVASGVDPKVNSSLSPVGICIIKRTSNPATLQDAAVFASDK